MMSADENKAVVERFVEAFWNQGSMAAADEMMTVDAKIYLPGLGQVSKETLKTFAATLRAAFPDWHSTLEEMIVEDDRVAERWTGHGTHLGEFQGIAPAGRQVAVPGFVFYQIQSGKIAEFRGLFDGMLMMHQLGEAQSPQQAKA